ncbi:Hypothetical protein, putative [Bodo saltans]|uniref:Uncharacterized protein n=1 Tax=Bodo saltans TaxID=75058 RepID=A0A0S4JUH2_BODSA|nr:Hypothetical protein, putative [Bodo saltans]|eukprot:CUG93881.1 Hypothetical protein, putative [Bodo saltans]
MNVSVDKLLQPYASYSRTGKMTESMSSSSIRVKTTAKPVGIDFSKSLAANELGHEEPADEAFLCSSPRLHPSVAQKSDYVSRQEMERAFRLSVKNVFEAPPSLLGDTSNSSSVHHNTSSKSVVPLMTPADWKAMKAALREANRKKAPHPSSAFLAVSRGKVGGGPNTSNNPPVGHYRPKYHIVEESAPGVKICKSLTSPRSSSPRGGGRHHHGRVPSPLHDPTARPSPAVLVDATLRDPSPAGSPLGDAPTFSPGGQQRTGASSPSNLAASLNGGKTQFSGSQGASVPAAGQPQQRALTPSWPFASASPGHVLQVNRSWSVEPDPTRKVNAALIERRSGGSKANLNLALAPGRKKINDAVHLKDVFYNANPFTSSHTPTYKFSVAPGRDRVTGLPRTSADVPRVASSSQAAPSDLDVSKYKRQPVLVDFARSSQIQRTRKLVANHSSPNRSRSTMAGGDEDQNRLEDDSFPASLSPQRVTSPDFRKYLARPQLKNVVSTDLLYDVSYQGLDRHEAAAFIKEPVVNHHVKPIGLIDNHHNAIYNPNDIPVHPTVVRSVISFDAYVSRDKRERSGREGTVKLNEAQHKFYNTDVVVGKQGNGNGGGNGLSNMAQQVSRDQRSEVLSPKRACVDTVYDGSASEGLLPGLRRGMVEMDKMVDREKRSHSSMR